MKKILSLMIAAVLLFSALLIFPLNTSAEEGKDIISPQKGQVFVGATDVEINIVTSHFTNDKDNYCEVLVYRSRDGLKVMERDLPYTSVGQTITTKFNSTEVGSFVIYISYYYGSGFIQYQDGRKMFLLNGSIIHAHDAASFTIEDPSATEPSATEPPATEPPATEPPATEPPATEPPATEPPSTPGVSGDYEYAYFEDGTAKITKYIGTDTEISIPSSLDNYTVTDLGLLSFQNCTNLSHIEIPDTIKRIGVGAFAGCTSLDEITIPDSAEEIGGNAFKRCLNLKKVNIGNSVQRILEHAFFWCDNLKSITIPKSVTYIDRRWEALGYTNTKDGFAPLEGFTIYGYSGTEAEKYAIDKGFTFIPISDEPEKPYILGDADGNGEIESVDATYIQRYIAKIDTPYTKTELLRADVDGSGDLELLDVTCIQRYLANLKTDYPIGQTVS